MKIQRRNLVISTGLGSIPSGFSSSNPARVAGEAPPQAHVDSVSSRISYSRFLQHMDEGAVKKVDLIQKESSAIVEIYNPALAKTQRVKVQLPGLPQELVRKMKKKDVDFVAYPPEVNMGAVILDLLDNLAFPLILLGSLLLRSSASNTPASPSLPFGLGR